MTGYEFADRLARALDLKPLEFADANYILDNMHQVSANSERLAVPLTCYLLGLADVSPTSVPQYIDMVLVQKGSLPPEDQEWTGEHFAIEMARVLSKSELTSGEASQILDAVAEAAVCADRMAVPLTCYLCGLKNKSPGEIGSSIRDALNLGA